MVETQPRRRSELEGTPRPERADAGLHLADASNRHSVWSLRAKDPSAFRAALGAALPTAVNRFDADNDRAIAKLGPDEWLLLAPRAEHEALTSKLTAAAEEAGAAVDLSERFATIELRGPATRDALAAACPLDLHPRAAAASFATRTIYGKADVTLFLVEDATALVLVNRSFAPYVWTLLLDAGREFGVDVV